MSVKVDLEIFSLCFKRLFSWKHGEHNYRYFSEVRTPNFLVKICNAQPVFALFGSILYR